MGILWEIKSKYQWVGTGVFNFHTTVVKGGLGHKSDFSVDLAKNHIVVVIDSHLSNPASSSIGVEKCGAFWAESCLGTRSKSETKNRYFLITQEITVNNPLSIHAIPGKLIRSDCWAGALLYKVWILVRFEIKFFHQVLPVFMLIFGVVLFAAGIESIGCTNATVQSEILGKEVLIHGH